MTKAHEIAETLRALGMRMKRPEIARFGNAQPFVGRAV